MAKIIIDNKIYDTEKSEKIIKYTKWVKGLYCPVRVEETLYRTKKNNWFVVMSDRFKAQCSIKNEEEVKIIFRELNEVELYEKYFEELEEA